MGKQKEPTPLMREVLAETRSGEEWTEGRLADILVVGLAVEHWYGPSTFTPAECDLLLARLEKQGVPARDRVKFLLRCLDYGWVDWLEPFGYKADWLARAREALKHWATEER